MSVVRCPQGHFYDDQRFSSCPHCGVSVTVSAAKQEETGGGSPRAKAHRRLFAWLEQDKTVALGRGGAAEAGLGNGAVSTGFGQGMDPMKPEGGTVSLEAAAPAEDDQKTIGRYSGARGNDFVTGWLVCVEGPEKGRDYRLHHGFNHVGRDFGMDVQVMDDPAISRKNHCSIAYDDRNNNFSIVPGMGTVTYFKEGLLEKAERLEAGDELRIGNSAFEFIPFCRKGRIWET